MPCKFSMIFMEYLRILGTEIAVGGASTRQGGGHAHTPWACPLSCGPTVAPSTYASTHTLLLPKKIPIHLKHEF